MNTSLEDDVLSLEEIYAASFIQQRFKDLVARKREAERAALAKGISKEEFEDAREKAKQEKREQVLEERRRLSLEGNTVASSPSKTASSTYSSPGHLSRTNTRDLEKRESKESKEARRE